MIMKCIQVMLFALCCFCDATIIPVQTIVDDDGGRKNYVNVSISGTSNIASVRLFVSARRSIRTHPAGLPLLFFPQGGDAFLHLGVSAESNYSIGTIGRLLTDPVDRDIETLSFSDGAVFIGPRTGLVSYYDSVDFIWNTANNENKLILNSSFEWFNTTACYPDSILSVPITGDEFTVGNHVTYMGRNITEIGTYTLCSVFPEMTDVSLEVFNQIEVALDHAGAPPPSGLLHEVVPFTFGNCTAVRELLPPISLEFETGVIDVYPDEYTEMISGDRCYLLISPPPRELSPGRRRLNPLNFKGINVRFTRNEMIFCESAIHTDITSVN